MEPATVLLTQSKFYSPVFNAAIFDGPIKIYFSQAYEGIALQLYFQIQRDLQTEGLLNLENQQRNIFVMLYPDSESFYHSFDKSLCANNKENELIVEAILGEDTVLGVRGPIQESTLSKIYDKIKFLSDGIMPNFLEEGSGALA